MYQGLDVVVFGPLKADYGNSRDELLRETGEAISKENFLKIYGEAHLRVLKPDLIRTAFRKTGIVPFDRTAISKDMMAPSQDTSYKVYTPIVPPTPIRIVTDLLVNAIQPAINQSDKNPLSREKEVEHTSVEHTSHQSYPVQIALPQLASTEAQFLVSQSPIKSSSKLPEMSTAEISPVKKHAPTPKAKDLDLLTVKVKTQLERQLQDELVVKEARIKYLKGYVLQLQSQMILQRVYCARVRRQLKAKEKKVEKKEKKGGRLMGDGDGKLLTGSAFFGLVDEYEAARDNEVAAKEARKQRRLDYETELEEWNNQEEARIRRNEDGVIRWEAAVDDWKARKQAAKSARKKVKEWEKENPKPKKTDPEFYEKATPRPKMKKTIEEEDDNEGDWTDEEEDEENEMHFNP